MKTTLSVHQYDLPLAIKREGNFYLAYCSQWSDCYAQGDTIDEALTEVQSVAASLVELYEEENIRIPLRLNKITSKLEEFRFNLPLVMSTAS